MPGRMGRRSLFAASAFALGVAAASQASAQAAADPTAPGWTKVCSTDAAGAQGCSTVFQIVAEGGQFIAQASLNQVTGQPDIIFSVWVRTGVLIQLGIRIQIDEQEPATVPYLLCDATICIGEVTVDDNFIQQLKRGGQLLVSTAMPAAPPAENGMRRADFPMTLVGFTAVYDGPGLDQAQAAARQDELNQTLQDRAAAARQRLIEQQQAVTPAAP